MAGDTRQRMLDTTVEMLRKHGYNGTGFRQVVAASGAPRGSMYHHFPGGKVQLGIEAVKQAGDFINVLISSPPEGDFVDGLEAFWAWWTEYVTEAGYAGCPIVAVAAEDHSEAPELTQTAAGVFAQWTATTTANLERAGLPRGAAEEISLLIIASLEGATVLSRAEGSRAPLERVGRRLAAMIRREMATSGTSPI